MTDLRKCIPDREKDDQTTIDRDEAAGAEVVDKYIVVIRLPWIMIDDLEWEALGELGIEPGTNEIEVIMPTPIGTVMRPQEAVKAGSIVDKPGRPETK